MTSSTQTTLGETPFLRLPLELFELIWSGLPNRDIKNLRLTCTHLCRVAQLRLSRLFLSPNPRNVDVFRAVADHDEFRKNIFEIVYDDARLASSYETPDDEFYDSDGEIVIGDVKGVPSWFRRIYRENSTAIKEYGCHYVKRPHHLEVQERSKVLLSPAESYKLHQKLVQEQDRVIATNSDADALRYGLPRFPNLRRITLTPVAHGIPARPFYQTPMIRSFPRLVYPIPRGWPVAEEQCNYPFAEGWDGEEKRKWRGFCLITHAVAQYQRENPTAGITEFIIDSNQLLTGINCRVFDDRENNEYKDLVTIFARPGFSRIDLSLHVGGQDEENWHSFRSGKLHHALSTARDLQHVSLSTDIAVPDDLWTASSGGEEHHLPLSTIFPIDIWSNLRHFCLSRFLVKQKDLMHHLHALPPTLRSVELSFLFFLPQNGHYESLLEDMRDHLDWRERATAVRPKIMICVDDICITQGLAYNLNREVEAFVYGGGQNPFSEDIIFLGTGTTVNAFDPESDRPNVSPTQLMELGILEWTDWGKQNYMYDPFRCE